MFTEFPFVTMILGLAQMMGFGRVCFSVLILWLRHRPRQSRAVNVGSIPVASPVLNSVRGLKPVGEGDEQDVVGEA